MQPIDKGLLLARDPILFYTEVPLYESELDDNGVACLTVKVDLCHRLHMIQPAGRHALDFAAISCHALLLCVWLCASKHMQALSAVCMACWLASARQHACCRCGSCHDAGLCCCAFGCVWTACSRGYARRGCAVLLRQQLALIQARLAVGVAGLQLQRDMGS